MYRMRRCVQLEILSPETLADVLALKVRAHQRDFLPSIASSIELASTYPDAVWLRFVEYETRGERKLAMLRFGER